MDVKKLLLATVVVAVGAWRGRYIGGLMAGVAVRLAMDPGTWNYYATGFILVAVAWDLCESRSRIPWACLAGSLALAPVWVYDQPKIHAVMRLASSLVAVGLVLWPTRGLRTNSDGARPVPLHRSLAQPAYAATHASP